MKVPKRKSLSLGEELKAYKAFEKTHPCRPLAKTSEVREDPVNSPKHYVRGGIEVIEVLEKKMTPEAFKGFLMGNVLKYVLRHEYKGGAEDLRKAAFYLQRMIDGTSSS